MGANIVFQLLVIYPFLIAKNSNESLRFEDCLPDWMSTFDFIGTTFFDATLIPLILIWSKSGRFRGLGNYSLFCIFSFTILNTIYRVTQYPPDWYFMIISVFIFAIFAYSFIRHGLLK
jgi:hypothetical protein